MACNFANIFFIAIIASSSINHSIAYCIMPVMAIKERIGNEITVECYLFFGGLTPHYCYNNESVPLDQTSNGVYSFNITKELEGRYKCCCSPLCNSSNTICTEKIFLAEQVPDPTVPTELEGIWGEPLTIQCPFTPGAHLQAYKYQWNLAQNGGASSNDESLYYFDGAKNNYSVTILNYNPLFDGIYTCKLTTHGNTQGMADIEFMEQSINVSVTTAEASNSTEVNIASFAPFRISIYLMENATFSCDVEITGNETVGFRIQLGTKIEEISAEDKGCKIDKNMIKCDNRYLLQGISTLLICSYDEPYNVNCELTIQTTLETNITGFIEIDCVVFDEFEGSMIDIALDSAYLIISAPPPTAVITPDYQSALIFMDDTSSISFTCTVTSFSNDTYITWTTTATAVANIPVVDEFFSTVWQRNDTKWRNGEQISIVTLNEMVSFDYEGTYCCYAETDGDFSDLACGDLIIEVPPPRMDFKITGDKVSAINSSTFRAELNSTLIFECSVTSFDYYDYYDIDSPPYFFMYMIEYDGWLTILSDNRASYDGMYRYVQKVNRTAISTHPDGSLFPEEYGCLTFVDAIDLKLLLFYPPLVVSPIPDQNVTVGHNVTFKCMATGYSLIYRWTITPSYPICEPHPDCIQGERKSELLILNISYSLEPITVNCAVNNKKQPLSSQSAQLQSAQLLTEGLSLLDQTEGYLIMKENKIFTITCTFEYPADVLEPVRLWWIEDYELGLNNSGTISQTDSDNDTILTTFSLVFSHEVQHEIILRSNLLANQTSITVAYQCAGIIGNRIKEVVLSDAIDVEIQFVVPEVSITSNVGASSLNHTYTAPYNSILVLECYTNTLLGVNFEWIWPDNQNIEHKDSYDGVSNHTSVVKIDSVTLETAGFYQCTATSAAGSGADSITINVSVPFPTFSHMLASQNATVGDNVTFMCIATGINLSYQWTLNPELYCNDDLNCVEGEHEQSLILQNVPRFSTTVTCTVTDVINQTQSQNATLMVFAAPPSEVMITSPYITSDNVLTVKNGTFLVLECSAESLVNVIFKWTAPNEKQLTNLTVDYHGSSHYTSAVTVGYITTQLAGIYTCIVENEGGKSNITVELRLYGASDESKSETQVIIAISTSSSGTCLAVVFLIILLCWRRSKKAQTYRSDLEVLRMSDFTPVAKSMDNSSQIQLDNGGSITLLEKIGEGQFGIVYRGILTDNYNQLPTPVAIKTLAGSFTESDVHNIVEESEKMKLFDHPNVLSLICVARNSNNVPCIVMPLMDRGSLLSYLKKERPKLNVGDMADDSVIEEATKKLLSMCLQVSKGMECLAKQMFVHRDLAARNCMISSDGIIKVADFGLAEDVYTVRYFRMEKNVTRVEPQLLPIKWTALEGIHDGLFSEKSDVWSFGVLCWEVFSLGRTPYGGMNHREIVHMLDSGQRLERPFNAACTEEIYSLMLTCWKSKPEDRPTFSKIVEQLESMIAPLADYMDFTQF